MEAKLKVYCVGYTGDAEWMKPYNFEQTMFYNHADVVVFPGGSDWNPSLYGESLGKNTSYYPATDRFQLKIALNCIRDRKFMIGICRGAQMMCILSGGKLIQHVDNHHRNHMIMTYDDQILITNSIHHQMFDLASIPDSNAYDMLAYAEAMSFTYLDGNNQEKTFANGDLYREELKCEPEIVYFKEIGGFAVQGHPEMMIKVATEQFIITEINKAYAQFTKSKSKLPGYINSRIQSIRKLYFQGDQQDKTIQNNEKQKNRSIVLEESRDWKY